MAMTEPAFDFSGKRVWVAGSRGMVGSALVRRLACEGCEIIHDRQPRIDLRRQLAAEEFVAACRPDLIFMAAAQVGGIQANNDYPASFLYDNLAIATHVIEAARQAKVGRLIFLGSSCVYPKAAAQPIRESALLSGPLEPTNQWYAVAKIAGLKLADAYRQQYGLDYFTAQPCNLYGPGDNFNLESSHVLPALLRKADAAKRDGADRLDVWGSGAPLREFLHVDDLADALVFVAKRYTDGGHVNIGSGSEISIRDLARLICDAVGFEGELRFDKLRPDGTMRKIVDSRIINDMGWFPKISIEDGIRLTHDWFVAHRGQFRDAETVAPANARETVAG